MTWDINAPYIPEVEKCRHRLLQYCEGQGLDLGCGGKKIKTTAIGCDIGKGADSVADFSIDLEGGLTLFASDTFDFVFSSHYLEHVKNPVGILREWFRVIRPGGNLVLYLPHRDLYPRIGQKGANPDHKNDFEPADIVRIMEEIGSYKILVNEIHAENDEYSFELVFNKVSSLPGITSMIPKKYPDTLQKTACVVRYGGIGDVIFATPVIRRLKEEGYHVTVNTSENGREMFKGNPNIDQMIFQGMNEVANADLEGYWAKLATRFDRFINLSGSCEKALLQIKGEEGSGFDLDQDERRAKYGNVNYYDYALKMAGFEDRGMNGEIFLTEEEELSASVFRTANTGRFIVIWALGGSGPHKRFPFYALAMEAFAQQHPEVLFVTVGGQPEKLLELAADDNPNYLHKSGRWTIRNVAAAVKYADLVVGPETGVLNMAGCFDTPKICMLTHSSWANLCKYWKNDHSVQSHQSCSPCHKMIYMKNDCPKDDRFKVCACATGFDPTDLLPRMKEVFKKWRRSNSTLVSLPVSASKPQPGNGGSRKAHGNLIQ
jgi:ADP-heptose:LPS heptosyltransferase/SAM-dependent methyltransferase